MYFNLVKFSKNLQNFLKRRLRRRFGRFAPENPKTLQSNPPSGRNPAIETPPQGVRDPIISSAWTPIRARMGSRASLDGTPLEGDPPKGGGGDFFEKGHIFGAEGAEKF